MTKYNEASLIACKSYLHKFSEYFVSSYYCRIVHGKKMSRLPAISIIPQIETCSMQTVIVRVTEIGVVLTMFTRPALLTSTFIISHCICTVSAVKTRLGGHTLINVFLISVKEREREREREREDGVNEQHVKKQKSFLTLPTE